MGYEYMGYGYMMEPGEHEQLMNISHTDTDDGGITGVRNISI
jgi:hypothetical protein